MITGLASILMVAGMPAFFKAPRILEIKSNSPDIQKILEEAPAYFQLQIDPHLLLELAPISAQTQHQLLWKIAENLPCPMESIAYCVEPLNTDLYQVSYLPKDFLQKLIDTLEEHGCQIDTVGVGFKKLEQIEFKKPWHSWQDIQQHLPWLEKGLKFLTGILIVSWLGSGLLNPHMERYWLLKQNLLRFQNQNTQIQISSAQHRQRQWLQTLEALSDMPAQTKATQLRFEGQSIQLQGESFRHHSQTLKTWLEHLGATLMYQESGPSLNSRLEFTAQISL